MADEKSQDKVVAGPGEEAKKTDTGDNNKTEAAAADAGSTNTSQERPRGQLPTHYRGMPKQWEKNQVPKKET
ncbi:hypothetical protein F5Y13DRAFT_93914 [Hypoxylon sp. FL1857]|nr:hypothetical protein F5Y13DRAFT_93914 [Hypoxylon sp. FL1857]